MRSNTSRAPNDDTVEAVGAVIVDGDRVCVIKRGHAPMAGAWSLPGGRVEPGESHHDALVREIREETGLSIEVGPLIEIVTIGRYRVHDHLCRPTGGALRAGDDASDVRMVRRDALSSLDVSEAVRRVVDAAFGLARR